MPCRRRRAAPAPPPTTYRVCPAPSPRSGTQGAIRPRPGPAHRAGTGAPARRCDLRRRTAQRAQAARVAVRRCPRWGTGSRSGRRLASRLRAVRGRASQNRSVLPLPTTQARHHARRDDAAGRHRVPRWGLPWGCGVRRNTVFIYSITRRGKSFPQNPALSAACSDRRRKSACRPGCPRPARWCRRPCRPPNSWR